MPGAQLELPQEAHGHDISDISIDFKKNVGDNSFVDGRAVNFYDNESGEMSMINDLINKNDKSELIGDASFKKDTNQQKS